MKKLIALVAAVVAMGSFSAFAADWVYTITSGTVAKGTSGTVSDGAWTFKASVAKNSTDLTVGEPEEAACPTELTPLDFSKPVVDSTDNTKAYTIVSLNCAFSYVVSKVTYIRDSAQYVGELTLPGEGLKTLGSRAFDGCVNMTGDLCFPATLTALQGRCLYGTGITSIYIAPTVTRCVIAGGYKADGALSGNKQLTNIVFAAGGDIRLETGHSVANCGSLVDADLSGVTDFNLYPGKEKDSSYAHFTGCKALANITLGAAVTNLPAAALFGENGTALKTVRFLGNPPTSLGIPYLYGISSSQQVTTIVPAECADAWKAYATDGNLDNFSSTWDSSFVASGIAPGNRLLILDRSDGKDLPTITAVTFAPYASSTNSAVISVEVANLLGGSFKIEVLAEGEAVSMLDDCDDSGTFVLGGLEPTTEYGVRVTAKNDNGSTVDESLSFKTFGVADAVKPTLFYDPIAKVIGLFYDDVSRGDLAGSVIYEITGDSAWEKDSTIKDAVKVHFDPTFANYKPTSCKNWFRDFKSIASIEGIEYLDVSECTSLFGLFCETAVTELDLSRFKTAKVTTVSDMFRNCKGLMTVYANENFTTLSVIADSYTFLNNTVLCGGEGTVYSGAHSDSEYARVDDPDNGFPGYFTYKAPPATPPTIVSVTVQAISNETATVCVRGFDLNGGALKIELFTDAQLVKSVESDSFGDFVFEGLTCGTTYAIKVTATNASGTAVDDSQSFSTWGTTTLGARAVYTEYDATLVFYYDDVDRSSWAQVFDFNEKHTKTWESVQNLISTVLFDESFKSFRPKTCASWFAYAHGKNEAGIRFVGMENLDTRDVTSMERMFYNTTFLAPPDTTYFNTKNVTTFSEFTRYDKGWTTMDCSSFDTRNAQNMNYMFCGCKTICANEKFNTDNVTSSSEMFASTAIVGGAGTVYSADHKDKEYARIDGGPDSATPGYFTYKAPPHQGLMLLVR